MYVGDEPHDVMAGRGAGFGATVTVATRPASIAFRQNPPHYRPDFLIGSMAEFIDLLDRLKYGDREK
jgi:phosphoglycolate phosphatase-like HAD superfamily hydrolase